MRTTTTPNHLLLRIALLTVVLTATSQQISAQETPDRKHQNEAAPAAGAMLVKLVAMLDRIASIQGRMEAAWPTRREDQLSEQPAPLRVQELRSVRARLEAKRDLLLRQLESVATDEVQPLLSALRASERPELIDALAPIVVRAGQKKGLVIDTLAHVAGRISPCPPSILNGLAALEKKQASLVLLDVALRDGRLAPFVAAGQTGEPEVWAQLIDLAESSHQHAKIALRAIQRAQPRGRAPLKQLVRERVESTRAVELKVALITHVGLFKHDVDVGLLKETFRTDPHLHVRTACIGAMGRLGEPAADFLLDQLSQSRERELQRAAMYALAGIGDERAIPFLMDLLDDAVLARDAMQALRRLSGQTDLRTKAVWRRWWRAQPQNPASKLDSEAADRVETVELTIPPSEAEN